MRKTLAKTITCILSLLLILSLFGCGIDNGSSPEITASATQEQSHGSFIPSPSLPVVTPKPFLEEMSVVVFKIGKADAIVITTKDGIVLIDAGEEEDGEELLAYLDQAGHDAIDYFIVSHFDKDHIGGADTVLNGISVKHVFQPDYSETGKEYEEYVDALQSNDIVPVTVTDTISFAAGDASFVIDPPLIQQDEERSDNDHSLVVSVWHGENGFLFTGDAEEKRLEELLQQPGLEHSYLKVPHHGQYNDKSKAFFKAVRPQYAVITCSDKNPEDQATVEALKEIGTSVFLTRNGNVVCLSDGKHIQMMQ